MKVTWRANIASIFHRMWKSACSKMWKSACSNVQMREETKRQTAGSPECEYWGHSRDSPRLPTCPCLTMKMVMMMITTRTWWWWWWWWWRRWWWWWHPESDYRIHSWNSQNLLFNTQCVWRWETSCFFYAFIFKIVSSTGKLADQEKLIRALRLPQS